MANGVPAAKREGRPARGYPVRRINANIALDLYAKVHKHAAAEGRTLTAVIERALAAYLRKQGRAPR